MSKPVIVCIDDEQAVLESLKIELKRSLDNEYLIETAEHGENALELFAELQADNYEIALVIAELPIPNLCNKLNSYFRLRLATLAITYLIDKAILSYFFRLLFKQLINYFSPLNRC